MIFMKVKITKEEFEKACKGNMFDLACEYAYKLGYYPEGYGLYNPCVNDEKGSYFVTWKRDECCD